MITLRSSFVAVLLLAAIAVSAVGGGFQLNEHGARAMAQGGAWVARAYDGSAIYFNPAGLAFQRGTHLLLGTTFIMPKSSFFGPDASDLSSSTNWQEWKMKSQTFTPINVYGSFSVSDDIVVGMGVYNPFGLGTEWPKDWAGSTITEKVDLQAFYFTPTVAYRVSDDLSVGVGVNYVMGNAKISRQTDLFNPPGHIQIDADGTGWGFNVGALYKLSSDLSIGASYRSSTKLTPKGTATFSPNRSVYPAGDVETKLELPSTAFLGLSYRAMDNLELEADFQFVGWSSYKELAFTFAKDNSVVTSPKNYKDTYILRVGGEYTLGDLQVRAGYLFDRNPVEDRYTEPLLPDANRNGLNIGVGYRLSENISLDLSYLFLKFDERKVTGTEVNFDGTYQSTANLFGVNLSYAF